MDMVFLGKQIVSTLVLPPGGPLLVALLGLALLRRMPRLGRVLSWTGVGALLAFSLPVVSASLMRLATDGPVLDLSSAKAAQAIVILAGGLRYNAAEYDGDTMNGLSLERLRYGAQVARVTGLPILVSGGLVGTGPPEARLMREILQEEFGMPVNWFEATSRDTQENATNSARLLRSEGVTRIVLVTHGFHMRRARREFAAAGMAVIPAPIGLPGGADYRLSFFDLVPSASALHGSYYATHELLGDAASHFSHGRQAATPVPQPEAGG